MGFRVQGLGFEKVLRFRVFLVLGFISTKKVYTFSSIRHHILPKSFKCSISASKFRAWGLGVRVEGSGDMKIPSRFMLQGASYGHIGFIRLHIYICTR